MSQGDWIKLILGAILTAGLTLAGQVIIVGFQHRQALERDRIQQHQARERAQWDKLLERVMALKDVAGRLYNSVAGAAAASGRLPATEMEGHLEQLRILAGQFAEYPDVMKDLWALEDCVGRILTLWHNPAISLRREYETLLDTRLPRRYRKLINTVNALLEINRPATPASARDGVLKRLRRLLAGGRRGYGQQNRGKAAAAARPREAPDIALQWKNKREQLELKRGWPEAYGAEEDDDVNLEDATEAEDESGADDGDGETKGKA